ncbi:MAG: hypothetical protein ABIM97_19150 [Ginsengibacter sp.]
MTFSILTFAGNVLHAQTDKDAIANIHAYTKYIDSLSDNDDRQTLISKSIAEGTITQESVSTSKVGHSNKIDTIRTTKNGGFGRYTIQNKTSDTVYKILYHDNINKNFYETYYYKDNQLVFAKIDYQEDGIGQTFYYREEYYQDDKMLASNESKKSIDGPFKERVAFDLRKKGIEYLNKFITGGH